MNKPLRVALCVPAYNEEKNIRHILHALTKQKTIRVHIDSIIVVCSGCTDDTVAIAQKAAESDPRIQVLVQPTRDGKAAAINAFLKNVHTPVVVVQSADTVPYPDCIEQLCMPFLDDPSIGLTGGAPIPVNDPHTFLGYIIHAWWWFHRNIPRFGEIIAFRNILPHISRTTAVDEAYIQAVLIKKGYRAVHVDQARVHNRGPSTVADLIRQRRRIFNGHARLYQNEKVKIDNMTKSSLHLLFFHFKMNNIVEFLWLVGGLSLEVWARVLGAYDTMFLGINPYVWETAETTKDLLIQEEQIV